MINLVDNIGIRFFLGSDSQVIDHVALVLTNEWTWLPLYVTLLVLIIKNNDNMQQILTCFGFAVLCVIIASFMANAVAKPLFERPRPCNTPEFMFVSQIAGGLRSKDFSFFSSHAANTMALATFFTLLVKSRALGVTMYVWSLVNCWTRLYLGQHFLTDVIVGMLWGILTGFVSFLLFKKVYRHFSPSLHFVSSQYTRSGYSQLDIDMVLSVFVLTVAYALIPNI